MQPTQGTRSIYATPLVRHSGALEPDRNVTLKLDLTVAVMTMLSAAGTLSVAVGTSSCMPTSAGVRNVYLHDRRRIHASVQAAPMPYMVVGM